MASSKTGENHGRSFSWTPPEATTPKLINQPPLTNTQSILQSERNQLKVYRQWQRRSLDGQHGASIVADQRLTKAALFLFFFPLFFTTSFLFHERPPNFPSDSQAAAAEFEIAPRTERVHRAGTICNKARMDKCFSFYGPCTVIPLHSFTHDRPQSQ